MFKRTYGINYAIQPSKKGRRTLAFLTMTFNGRLSGNKKNQAKMLNTLCRIHRVNPNAITVEKIILVETKLAFREWVGNLFDKLMRRVPA